MCGPSGNGHREVWARPTKLYPKSHRQGLMCRGASNITITCGGALCVCLNSVASLRMQQLLHVHSFDNTLPSDRRTLTKLPASVISHHLRDSWLEGPIGSLPPPTDRPRIQLLAAVPLESSRGVQTASLT